VRARLLFGAVVGVASIVAAPVSTVLAAPPPNDAARNAVAVSLGFTQTLDTTEATTGPTDQQLNESCGAPATDASVWYRYEAASDGRVVVDVSPSDYSAGVAVGIGRIGSLETVACGPGAVLFDAEAGERYLIVAFDFQEDGGGNGGQLSIEIAEAPDAPVVSLSVDPEGRLDRRGNAIITGTYRCEGGDFVDVFGDVLQIQRRAVRGFFSFFEEQTCDGTRRSWEVLVEPEQGRFEADRSLATTIAFSCGQYECADDFVEEVVRLRPPKDPR